MQLWVMHHGCSLQFVLQCPVVADPSVFGIGRFLFLSLSSGTFYMKMVVFNIKKNAFKNK